MEMELHLLDFLLDLIFLCLFLAFVLLVLPLPKVKNAADWWLGLGVHLDEVKIGFLCATKRVLERDDADLLVGFGDETDGPPAVGAVTWFELACDGSVLQLGVIV